MKCSWVWLKQGNDTTLHSLKLSNQCDGKPGFIFLKKSGRWWTRMFHLCQIRVMVDQDVENWEFERCSNSTGLVVSQVLLAYDTNITGQDMFLLRMIFISVDFQVFCLPVDYRKDVLPPCKFYQNFWKNALKFNPGKSSSILFQRVGWWKIYITLFSH